MSLFQEAKCVEIFSAEYEHGRLSPNMPSIACLVLSRVKLIRSACICIRVTTSGEADALNANVFASRLVKIIPLH